MRPALRADLTVYVITFCRRLELLYGSTLVFGSLRVGFPTAKIVVLDNASLPEARPALRAAAAHCGAVFHQLLTEADHAALLWKLCAVATGPIVFVDPDVIFWERVEHWRFARPLAGRLIPEFRDEFSGCITRPRLHTSFLWLNDPAAFHQMVQNAGPTRFGWGTPHGYEFAGAAVPINGVWYRWDTGAVIYEACPDIGEPFRPEHLDAYDHLFCGSHLDAVAPRLRGDMLARTHRAAQTGDLKALRGIWRQQEAHFQERRVDR